MTLQLKDVHEAADAYSSKASENARVLALAGIALVWWLSGEDRGHLTSELLATAGVMSLVLALDLAHCVVGYRRWDAFGTAQERAGKAPEDLVRADGRRINAPIYAVFYAKLVALVAGYALLSWQLYAAMRAARAG